MEIVRGFHNLKPNAKGCVATIGNFDGVHLGHKMLLDRLFLKSSEFNAPSVLVTFEPQPREFFAGEKVPARLSRFREKVTILAKTELDRLICLPFNEKTQSVPANWFTEDFLSRALNTKYLLVGDDFRFGRGREGDFELLEKAGSEKGFEVERAQTLEFEGERISSSRVRESLANGDFELAKALMGRPYSIMGRVVYGRQLGRQLGVPTANVRLQRYRSALEGVYSVSVDGLDVGRKNGIANIGIRPTVGGKEPLLEVHLFDFSGDIYGQLISVTFHQKIRDEQQFASIELLKAQIEKDIVQSQDWFLSNA
jgi:riboflavin kinase/FMN adenylyltransferase